MTSPEWLAADEDDSDRFPQASDVSTTFTFKHSCGATVHVVDAKEQPHECSNVPSPDPARVARYAEAAMEVLDASPLSAAMSHGYAFGVAQAVIPVADEERAALVAEVERLRVLNKGRLADLKQANLWSWELLDRAEAAEAKVAKVEALADEWGAWTPSSVSPPTGTAAAYERGIRACVESLRAVLADAPAERPDLDRPCACGHLLTDHLDGLACYAGTTVTSEFACDCREWRPGAPAEQRAEGGA